MLPFETSQAVEIVRRAAEMALSLQKQLGGKVGVEVKADETLVTDADRALEAFLREELGRLAPDWSFLGEEGGLVGSPDAPCWIIDPIDGTTNFVRGLPLWCISVGAVENGKAIFGVVAVPPIGEILYGAQGQGAFCERNGETIRLQVQDSATVVQEDLIACNTTVERVVDFKGVPSRLRNFGSLAYHMVAMAKGCLCASIAHGYKLYDVAGGICLCEEAGCIARYINGQEWTAEVAASRETMPLLVAAPQTMQFLMNGLKMY